MSSIKAWLHHCGVWICIAFFTASHHSLDICSTSIHAANGTTLSYKSLWFFLFFMDNTDNGQLSYFFFNFIAKQQWQYCIHVTFWVSYYCDFNICCFFFHENIYERKERKENISFFFKFMIELVMLYAVCTLDSNASLVSGSLPQIDFVTVTLRTT